MHITQYLLQITFLSFEDWDFVHRALSTGLTIHWTPEWNNAAMFYQLANIDAKIVLESRLISSCFLMISPVTSFNNKSAVCNLGSHNYFALKRHISRNNWPSSVKFRYIFWRSDIIVKHMNSIWVSPPLQNDTRFATHLILIGFKRISLITPMSLPYQTCQWKKFHLSAKDGSFYTICFT